MLVPGQQINNFLKISDNQNSVPPEQLHLRLVDQDPDARKQNRRYSIDICQTNPELMSQCDISMEALSGSEIDKMAETNYKGVNKKKVQKP